VDYSEAFILAKRKREVENELALFQTIRKREADEKWQRLVIEARTKEARKSNKSNVLVKAISNQQFLDPFMEALNGQCSTCTKLKKKCNHLTLTSFEVLWNLRSLCTSVKLKVESWIKGKVLVDIQHVQKLGFPLRIVEANRRAASDKEERWKEFVESHAWSFGITWNPPSEPTAERAARKGKRRQEFVLIIN
jgi:hypothetical protein